MKDINRCLGTFPASASIIIIIILIVEIAVILQNVFILYMVIMMYNPNMRAQFNQTFFIYQHSKKCYNPEKRLYKIQLYL